MSPREHEVQVAGEAVEELKDWASLWADLLHVDMTLAARRGVSDEAANLFVRRALWEAAVISYGRTGTTGRRGQRDAFATLVEELGDDAAASHDDVMAWRDRHVAHRVDRLRESVDVRLIMDADSGKIARINVSVATALGPEDEDDDLVERLERHVKGLRNLLWETQIQRLQGRVMDDYADRAGELLTRAEVPARGLRIDISA